MPGPMLVEAICRESHPLEHPSRHLATWVKKAEA